jgi:hypothetical protein
VEEKKYLTILQTAIPGPQFLLTIMISITGSKYNPNWRYIKRKFSFIYGNEKAVAGSIFIRYSKRPVPLSAVQCFAL